MKLKMINLEDEQFTFLSTVDASKLIRELLSNHMKDLQPMTLEQKQKRLAELKAKLKYEQEIEAINGNSK